MGPPEYVEVVWRGEGQAELHLASNSMKRKRDLQHQLHHNVIKCNISSCSIRELEKRESISTMEHHNVQEEEHNVTGTDTELTVPPGVNVEVWQAWLDYWQAWKDIYVTLSWVHKHRNVCKADFVAWYDTYMAENSWILSAITEELWSSDEKIITQSNTCPTPSTEQYLTRDHTALFDNDNTLHVIECNGENVSKTEEGSTHIISDAGNVDTDKTQGVGEVNSCENESENMTKFCYSNVEYEKDIKTKEMINGPEISLETEDCVGEETDEEKNMDAAYEKHSHQRYWVHLRSFLLESGIEVNDEIQKFVTERAGLCCTVQTDNSESSEVYDNIKDNENDTQGASECVSENVPRKENHQNDEVSIEMLAEGYGNTLHITQDDESTTFGSQCVIVGACEEVETNNICGNGTHNSRSIEGDEYKRATQKVDDYNKVCTNVVELNITDPGNDDGSQINTNCSEGGEGPDDCVTMTDNNNFSTPRPSTTRKWKKNKSAKARFDAGVGWALSVINKNNHNSRGGDQEADVSNAAEDSGGEGGPVNLVIEGPTNEVADSKSFLFAHKKEDNISLALQQSRGRPMDKEDNWRQDMNLGKQQNNQSQEKQTEIVSSKSLNWLPRCHQISWWKSIAQATFEHILTFSMVFSDGMNQPPLNLKLPFLAPPLDRLQMTKIASSVGKDDRKVQETESRTNSYIEREDLNCEQQMYRWLRSHLSLSSNIPEQDTLESESTLELSGVLEETKNQRCEKFYYKLKSELEDGRSRQELELLDFHDENGSGEMTAWCDLTAGYKQIRYGDQVAPSDLPQELHKYWAQRHRFFIKFDEGIKLDHESWFSVTPEIIAMHQAFRCQSDVVVDAFCGAGGNAIQLARTCCKVIAIDNNPEKIALARHNAEVYQVSHRIEFIVGDFFKLAPSLKADAVLLSPPWGGVDYYEDHIYDVMTLGGNMRCDHLMTAARTFTSNIALYLPRNSNIIQILQLAEAGSSVDIESSYMGRKKKALTVYFGALVGDEY